MGREVSAAPARGTLGRIGALAGAAAGGLAAALGIGAGGWIAYSRLGVDHHLPLDPAIPAESRRFDSPAAGALHYYRDSAAPGRPLVLIHSINAAASAYELRPLFERFRADRPVYALDLPGFGFSARDDRAYSPALYAGAIADFLRTQIAGGPADVVALSLGCEFAARVALDAPDLVRSLALISPSGFNARQETAGSQRAAVTGKSDRLLRAFSVPLWSQAFYDLLVTPPSVRYYLRQSFEGEPDPGLVAYDYATAHQPGARFAPLSFISGKLFSPDIRPAVYERLTGPVLVIHDRDNFVRFDTLPAVLARHPNWRRERIAPTKGLPHFEQPERTAAVLEHFWRGLD